MSEPAVEKASPDASPDGAPEEASALPEAAPADAPKASPWDAVKAGAKAVSAADAFKDGAAKADAPEAVAKKELQAPGQEEMLTSFICTLPHGIYSLVCRKSPNWEDKTNLRIRHGEKLLAAAEDTEESGLWLRISPTGLYVPFYHPSTGALLFAEDVREPVQDAVESALHEYKFEWLNSGHAKFERGIEDCCCGMFESFYRFELEIMENGMINCASTNELFNRPLMTRQRIRTEASRVQSIVAQAIATARPGGKSADVAGQLEKLGTMYKAAVLSASEFADAKALVIGDTAGQLERLKKLKEQGALSPDEFAAAKAKVLGVNQPPFLI